MLKICQIMSLLCSQSTSGHPSYSSKSQSPYNVKKVSHSLSPAPLHSVLFHPLPTQLHPQKPSCSSRTCQIGSFLGLLHLLDHFSPTPFPSFPTFVLWFISNAYHLVVYLLSSCPLPLKCMSHDGRAFYLFCDCCILSI